MSIAEKLTSLHFEVDDTPHITVNGARCVHCRDHPCLTFCPALCFTPDDQAGVNYYHVGCVECGTCLVLCNREAVTWQYPQGGYGIIYRY